MGPFSFLTPKIATIAGLAVLGTGGAVTAVVITRPTASVTPPQVTAPARFSPSVTTLPTSTGVLHTVSATPVATAVATAAPTPHATAPVIIHTSLPTVPATGPPVITGLTVSPDTWETWDGTGSPAQCNSHNPVTPSSTTYAYLLATISAPYGVHSVTAEYSFPGNSSSVFPLDQNYGSSTQWSTEIGGYNYINYTGGSDIVGVETVTYTVHVTDNHGTTVSQSITNHLHQCDPNPLKP